MYMYIQAHTVCIFSASITIFTGCTCTIYTITVHFQHVHVLGYITLPTVTGNIYSRAIDGVGRASYEGTL